MESVPVERAEAAAEQQGRDLTAKLIEPPKSISSKAGEIEQKSPLFRDTEANPQQSIFSRSEPPVPEHFKPIASDLGELGHKYDALGTPNYVSGDKAKELLPQWKDVARRSDIEESIHPDASRAAYDLFRQKLQRVQPGDSVLLVTGPVAAGKTTASAEARKHAALTYEVNLSNPAKAKGRVDPILAQGAKPEILHIHTTPALSAQRRALRAPEEHRPVSIDRSTAQHIQLPRTVAQLADEYKDRLHLQIFDNSIDGAPDVPIEKLPELAYPKGEDDLVGEQQAELDTLRASGVIGETLHDRLSTKKALSGNRGQREERPESRSERIREGSPTEGTGRGDAGVDQETSPGPLGSLFRGESGSLNPSLRNANAIARSCADVAIVFSGPPIPFAAGSALDFFLH